jgi:type I restriction enzyme M protein
MGSGGFFISSEKFIEAHNGNIGDISVYGQESNPTTWRLAAMNMAIRGIDFNFGKEARSSFTNDQHPDLRADFVLANPPFNQKEEDWWDASLENDARWSGYPTPPKGNANFAWMLHMLHHTDPTTGVVGLVLANGSLSSTTNNEGEIRKQIVQNDLVEAIIALPSQLFANTQIPACVWILNRDKKQKNKTLFIDARDFGYMIDRKQRDFSSEDIKTISDMFHKFRTDEEFENIAGKYYSATIDEIAKQEFILTPGRYVGTQEIEDDGVPFSEKMQELTKTLNEQFKESVRLEAMIKENLAGLGYEI